jgi:hypothetical protein
MISISKYKSYTGWVGLFVGVIGLLILFRCLIQDASEKVLWGNDFDPNLITWIVEWGFHALFEKFSWGSFWNANQFFPHGNSLAYSDSIIAAQFFYAPLRFAGFEPLNALYGTLIGFTLFGCIFSDWALVHIGIYKPIERAIIIYVAHFSMTVTTFLGGHYQLFGFQLAPPFFLFLYLFLRDLEGKYLMLTCVMFIFATGFATYFAPMSATVVFVLLLLIILIFRGNATLIRADVLKKTGYFQVTISLIFLYLFFVLQLKPYLTLFSHLASPQDWNETATYSANFLSLILDMPSNSQNYVHPNITNGYWERSYSPGFVILLFVSIGSIVTIDSLRDKNCYVKITGTNKAMFSIEQYAFFLFFISYLLSLGPFLTDSFLDLTRKIYLPFALFAKILPGVDAIRAPGRFGMFFGLPFGILTITGLRFICSTSINYQLWRYSKFLILFVLPLLVFDGMLISKTYPFTIKHRNFYERLNGLIYEHEPILVLPLAKNGHMETITNYMEQLKGSTIHYGWLVSGYGSRSTPELSELTYLDQLFQSGKLSLSGLLNKAREMGIYKVIIFKSDYESAQRVQIDSNESNILFESEEELLLCLSPSNL